MACTIAQTKVQCCLLAVSTPCTLHNYISAPTNLVIQMKINGSFQNSTFKNIYYFKFLTKMKILNLTLGQTRAREALRRFCNVEIFFVCDDTQLVLPVLLPCTSCSSPLKAATAVKNRTCRFIMFRFLASTTIF